MNERERIELLMKSYGLTPSQFSDKTGIQRASVSHILSGRNKPSLEVMQKIFEAFPGVDIKWLMTGVGEEPAPEAMPAVMTKESLQEQERQQTQAVGGLFAAVEPLQPSPIVREEVVSQPVEGVKPRRLVQQRDKAVVEQRPKRYNTTRAQQPVLQVPEKRIKEVRIFYTDGTYETLVPEK